MTTRQVTRELAPTTAHRSDPMVWSFVRRPDGSLAVAFDAKQYRVVDLQALSIKQTLRDIEREITTTKE